jgi:hypothetical protein
VNDEMIRQMGAPPAQLKVAGRSAVAPFIVMDVLSAANERAAAGEDIVHLEVGERVVEGAERLTRWLGERR